MSTIKFIGLYESKQRELKKCSIITICKYLVIIYKFATLTVNNPNV